MKRFLICLLIIFGIIYLYKDRIIIPNESIRVRIIANSNSEEDQKIKSKVKDNVENNLYDLLKDVNNIEEARSIINDNISLINNDINNILKSDNFNINYGYNYFPQKEYKGIKYESGMYESLVVTLGSGKGENWWCVMFPPFCLIEAQDKDMSEVEYKWLVKEMINKYFEK